MQILNTPWLPFTDDPYVHSYNKALVNQDVSSLMHTGYLAWDVDLIRDIFKKRDAELILSIPLGNTDKDTWYWPYEKMGQYSIKSAYIHLYEAK